VLAEVVVSQTVALLPVVLARSMDVLRFTHSLASTSVLIKLSHAAMDVLICLSFVVVTVQVTIQLIE
jgi:hypothetical protein